MNKTICIITTSYPNWNFKESIFQRGKFVHDMAKALTKYGYDVHIVTHRPYGVKKRTYKIDNINIHYFNYFIPRYETLTRGSGLPENIKKTRNKLLVPLYFVCLFSKAISVIKNNNIKIINAHWAVPTGYIAVWLKLFTKAKLVTTIYGAELFPVIKGKMRFLKPFIKTAINNADMVAGISEATVNAAKELSGREDIHIIPDGIDIDYYMPGPKNAKLLEKYNCLNNKVIFFTGRMVERKGHRYLLEAMKYVTKEMPNIKFILGGKGPLYDDLIKLRKTLKLENIVEMPGFIPEKEMVSLLQSVDLYVLPSCIDKNGDTEGSATAALEAMACGTPAIISKVGGNIGAIEEGEGAYYCKPSNAKDLAEKIIMMFINEDIYMKNALVARDYIIDNYSWKITIGKYEKLLLQ